MRLLYMDNYRGFKDTYLNLKKVNFFVGDNSSGKTSVIELIALLSSRPFLMNIEFNNEKFQLGTFDDIADKEYKDNFVVGYLITGLLNQSFIIALMKFKRGESGKIKLSEYIISRSKEILHFKINSDKDGFRKYHLISRNKMQKVSNHEETKKIFREAIKLLNLEQHQTKEEKYIRSNYFIERPMDMFYRGYEWIPPIRTSPKRFYEVLMSNPNSEQNMPYFLNKICQESNYKNIKKEIEKIAKKATLFKGLTSRKFYDNDDSPFAIELSMGKNVNRNLFHLGYGVSQALPILATISFSGVPNKVLLIQQPEVHLHPKAQVAIGDLIFDKASKKFTNFVIETHSDHIIDRFRYAQKKSKDKKVSSQVVFFARKTKGNSLYTIDIEKDGKYSEKQPKSFRDFFLKESMKLLEL